MVPVMSTMAATVAAPQRTTPETMRTAASPRNSSHLILGLQRAAGNRAVGRMLARCPGCGGTCGGKHTEDETLLEEGQRALRRAVAQR
jgi:hypothetical protein